MRQLNQVVKRTGAVVPFNPERITNAIYRAAVAVGGRDRQIAEELTRQVIDLLVKNGTASQIPTVEEIQDAVEKVLIENGHARGGENLFFISSYNTPLLVKTRRPPP